MLGVVNHLLTIPRDNDHFGCFFENSLNRGVQNSEPSAGFSIEGGTRRLIAAYFVFKSLFFALFWHLWLCWRASYFISDHLLLKNLLRTLPSIYISPVPRHHIKLRFHCARGITHCTFEWYTTSEVNKKHTLHFYFHWSVRLIGRLSRKFNPPLLKSEVNRRLNK